MLLDIWNCIRFLLPRLIFRFCFILPQQSKTVGHLLAASLIKTLFQDSLLMINQLINSGVNIYYICKISYSPLGTMITWCLWLFFVASSAFSFYKRYSLPTVYLSIENLITFLPSSLIHKHLLTFLVGLPFVLRLSSLDVFIKILYFIIIVANQCIHLDDFSLILAILW